MNNMDQDYELPYGSPEINPFILIAKNANIQAESAEAHISLSIRLIDNTRDMLLPELAEANKTAYSTPVILAHESLNAAIQAAIKARGSESKALHTALIQTERILKQHTENADRLENDIIALKQQAEDMRSNFTNATDSPILMDSSNDEAKSLLAILEKIYEKYRQIRKNNENINEMQTNLEYIKTRHQFSCSQLKKIEESQNFIDDKIRQTNDYLGIKQTENTAVSPDSPDDVAATEDQEDRVSEDASDTHESRPTAGALIWSYFKIIIAALFLAFIIRSYVFDVTQVDGLSMYPTLHDKDDLINSEISYLISDPKRGDIIVFDAPDSAGEDYVKRVIGLPNEEIVIERGMVYINGELLDEPYIDGAYTEGDIRTVIPDGFYFVMGDNRAISRDSRLDTVGLISIDRIKGVAVFRIYPFSSFGTID